MDKFSDWAGAIQLKVNRFSDWAGAVQLRVDRFSDWAGALRVLFAFCFPVETRFRGFV